VGNGLQVENDFYLLVSSDPKNPVAPLKYQVVNANREGFQLGSRTLNLKPNTQRLVDPPQDTAGSYSRSKSAIIQERIKKQP
jgi:hypothetical protein